MILYYQIVNKRAKIARELPEEALFHDMWEYFQDEFIPMHMISSFMLRLAEDKSNETITDHGIKFLVGSAFATSYTFTMHTKKIDRYLVRTIGKRSKVSDLVNACYQLFPKEHTAMTHMFIDVCEEAVEEYFLRFKGIDLSDTKDLLDREMVETHEKFLINTNTKVQS